MSTRYSERDYGRIDRDEPRGSQYGRGYDSDYERGYSGRGREGRGFTERAGDEVRSWFGDEDADLFDAEQQLNVDAVPWVQWRCQSDCAG